MASKFDYAIVGSGIGGLVLAALLARNGDRVCLIERHYQPGGYGHSFQRRGYTFCAELHYLWNCGPGQDFDQLLKHLGLEDDILFSQLDPQGYDHFVFPSFRYRLRQGLESNIQPLAQLAPGHQPGLEKYFRIISRINREVYRLPVDLNPGALLAHPWKFRNILRYRNWTTQDLFDRLGLPLPVQSILAGQMGDIGVPPAMASLIVQAALTCGYDSGAYVPTKGFEHLFDQLLQFIDRQPGCEVRLNTEAISLDSSSRAITSVGTRQGDSIRAKRFVYNGDPALLRRLVGNLPEKYTKRLDYEYSPSSFTLYLGVRDLDLASYGFGNWNIWHYQHDDLNRVYREQVEQSNLDQPFLFMSTPTLHQHSVQLAPDGCQQLVVCTAANYDHFARLKTAGRDAYRREKDRVTDNIINQIERHYVPGLKQHLDLIIAGSPTTNERFVLAPRGNAYGAHLTPRRLQSGHIDCHTPFDNLWLVGATATAPSFAGGTHWAILLYEHLSGQKILN